MPCFGVFFWGKGDCEGVVIQGDGDFLFGCAGYGDLDESGCIFDEGVGCFRIAGYPPRCVGGGGDFWDVSREVRG